MFAFSDFEALFGRESLQCAFRDTHQHRKHRDHYLPSECLPSRQLRCCGAIWWSQESITFIISVQVHMRSRARNRPVRLHRCSNCVDRTQRETCGFSPRMSAKPAGRLEPSLGKSPVSTTMEQKCGRRSL